MRFDVITAVIFKDVLEHTISTRAAKKKKPQISTARTVSCRRLCYAKLVHIDDLVCLR
jgi:hypothetical protein